MFCANQFRWFLFLVLALAGERLLGVELPKASQKWLGARSQHFLTTSCLDQSDTQELTQDFERFRAMLHRVLGEGNAKGQILELPVKVFLFSNSTQFEQYCNLPSRTGYYLQDMNGFNLALVQGQQDARRMVFHEYFHYHLRRIAPDLNYPLWANEGLACLYEMTSLEKKLVKIGMPNSGWLRTLIQERPLPMARLLQVQYDSPEYQKGPVMERFYASSWLAAHYLTIGNPARRRQMPEYLGRLRAGHTPEEAFQAAFKTTPEGLDQELSTYLHTCKRSMAFLEVPLLDNQNQGSIRPEPLPHSEVLSRLGFFLSGHPSRVEDARSHFQEALRVDSGCALAMAGMSHLGDLPTPTEASSKWIDQAIEAKPDPMFYFMRARLGLRQGINTPEKTTAVLKDLLEATKAGIGEPWALDLAGQLGGHQGLNAGSLELLGELAELCPTHLGLRLGLALGKTQQGQFKEARTLLEPLTTNQDPEVAGKAGIYLSQIDAIEKQTAQQAIETAVREKIRQAESRISAEDPDGALILFRQAKELNPQGDLAQWLDQTMLNFETKKARPPQTTRKGKAPRRK